VSGRQDTEAVAPDFVGVCCDCGYPLRGLPLQRCPECGRRFAANDPLSFVAEDPPSSLRRLLAGPVGLPTHIPTVVAVLVSLWRLRVPGAALVDLWSPEPLFAWGLVAILWSVRLTIARCLHAGPVASSVRSRRSSHWLVFPFLLTLTLVLWQTQLPATVAFRLSRPGTERLAEQCASLLPGARLSDRVVGLYSARAIEVIPGGFRFAVGDNGGLLSAATGFAYHVSGPPPSDKHNQYVHWTRDWYVWTEYPL
jgi:hypothetical protein